MVMGYVKPHPCCELAVFSRVLVSPRNGHISAKAQKCLKSHLPGLFVVAIDVPGCQQNFIINEPSSVADSWLFRFV